MALKSTVYKADLEVSDLDRNCFDKFGLTIAKHPSETDERVMVRCLAFALHAIEDLVFAKGISDTDEPDIWQKDLTGIINLWVEVGQPDEKRILKACGRSKQVVIYSYSNNSAIWWSQTGPKVARAKNLTVINLPTVMSQQLAKLAGRNMQLQCTVQDGQIWFSAGEETVFIELTRLM